jgi:hypothetical protein
MDTATAMMAYSAMGLFPMPALPAKCIVKIFGKIHIVSKKTPIFAKNKKI